MLAFSSQPSPAQWAWLFRLTTLLLVVPVTGFAIVHAPILAWLILGLSLALVFLEFSSIYWVVIAVAAATLSRVTSAAGVPHFINFVHFPLAVGAFAVALLKGETSQMSRAIRSCLWIFLGVNIVSWLINTGEPLRPLLNWLVLAEPFMILYVVLAAPATERMSRFLWTMLLTIAFLQVPLGVYQRLFISNGNPDLVQGTFIGSGTGAHVAGAVAMLGATLLICLGASCRNSRTKLLCLAGAMPLFGLAAMADAKQAIVAFVPGLIYAVLKITGIRLSTVLLPAISLCLLIAATFYFYKPLQMLGDRALVAGGMEGKATSFKTILSKMDDTPAGWFIGLGPGNTVSRVALMTPEAQLDATSSVSMLGLKTAPVTRQLIAASSANFLMKSSSAWSPECSWFGLIGDLGLAGTAAYVWMLWIAWTAAGTKSGWLGSCAQGSLIAMVLLGGVYSWLEEPGFTLLVALTLGLATRSLPRLFTR